MKRIIPIAFITIILSACAHSRFVEPLEKDEIVIGVSLGGPGIDFDGIPMVLPLSNIEVGYGMDTNLTIHGGCHTTAALFGNLQIDAGVTYKFLEQKKYRPNLSVSPSLNFIYSFGDKSARLWPILDLNAYWNYGKRNNYFYAGFNNYFELKQTMANDQDQKHNWIFSPQIGHIIKGKKRPWQFTAEIKLLAPYLDNSKSFIPYKSLLGKWGSTGVYLGFRYPIKYKK